MNPTNIFNIKELCGDRFYIMPHPQGGEQLHLEIENWKKLQIDVVVSLLTIEEQFELKLNNERMYCEKQNIIYLNYPIKDELPNSVNKTIAFVNELENHLKEKSSFLFHCRGGVGRSSMMLALLASRLGITTEESFELITKSRGENAPESQKQKEWINTVTENSLPSK